jgi:peptidoglycan/LPS O-acetylase OafA/YrhL
LYWKVFREPLEALGWSLPVVQAIYHVLAFAATYGLARLSWRFIEKPFLDRK